MTALSLLAGRTVHVRICTEQKEIYMLPISHKFRARRDTDPTVSGHRCNRVSLTGLLWPSFTGKLEIWVIQCIDSSNYMGVFFLNTFFSTQLQCIHFGQRRQICFGLKQLICADLGMANRPKSF